MHMLAKPCAHSLFTSPAAFSMTQLRHHVEILSLILCPRRPCGGKMNDASGLYPETLDDLLHCGEYHFQSSASKTSTFQVDITSGLYFVTAIFFFFFRRFMDRAQPW